MEANVRTPRDMFDGKVCYQIPVFQRPYVWTEEDQWQPLWDDISKVAESVLALDGDNDEPSPSRHFLGAVVVKQLPSVAGDPSAWWVIDGQQRLTTLQLLLDAAQHVMEHAGHAELAETLQELVLNDSKRFKDTSKRFKLWPSRPDRNAFERVMDNAVVLAPELADTRIALAHKFFRNAIVGWLDQCGDESTSKAHLTALSDVLQQRLQIVAIDLSGTDDDQLIFETLNDRGTPLLAADLIKNYAFQRLEAWNADVDKLSDQYWRDFDDDWWREQVSQGRLYRSRIDLFLQYWLTMRIKDEIPTDAVFARFRTYSSEHLGKETTALPFLAQLRRDADTFREFAQLDTRSARGSFYDRVVEALELGAFIPLLLWLLSEKHAASPLQADKALTAVESWAVRRTLLRRTMKDVNKLVVALLRELDQHPPDHVGDVTVDYLSNQTADSRVWPSTETLVKELPTVKAYGSIKQPRLRAILSGIEMKMRTKRNEDVSLPAKLEIEHVMPQGWRSYWSSDIAKDHESMAHRDILVNTIGNLTLVTQPLNGALSNRPWTDSEAEKVAPIGKDAGLGKRTLLGRNSILVLNKDIVDQHIPAWTNADIEKRSTTLALAIADAWPFAEH